MSPIEYFMYTCRWKCHELRRISKKKLSLCALKRNFLLFSKWYKKMLVRVARRDLKIRWKKLTKAAVKERMWGRFYQKLMQQFETWSHLLPHFIRTSFQDISYQIWSHPRWNHKNHLDINRTRRTFLNLHDFFNDKTLWRMTFYRAACAYRVNEILACTVYLYPCQIISLLIMF